MAVREGRWDCQYCGTIGVLGRHKACPVCGAARPLGTKFYLPKDAEAVEDADLVGYAQKGPDWVCDACSSSNPADVRVCKTCGAERGSAQSQAVIDYELGETRRKGDMDFSEPAPRPQRMAPQTAAQSAFNRNYIFAGIGAFVLLICGILVAINLFGSENKAVSIDHFNWERTAAVEAFQTIVEEGWDVPSDGRILSSSEEIRSYNKVQIGSETRTREVSDQVQVGSREYKCGERDLGNGFFEDVMCSEPVYETRYRTETYEEPIYEDVPIFDTYYKYEVDRWVEVRTEKAAAQDNKPFWPALNLTDQQREGERTEKYSIVFVDGDGELYDMEFTLDEWLTFEPNGNYELKVSGLGVPLEIIR